MVVGSASKKLRMIGWRVGWIAAPEALVPDLVAVSLANVVVPVGIAQAAAAIALQRSEKDLPAYVSKLQARRDLLMAEFEGLPVDLPSGGWSLLLRSQDLGFSGEEASQRLLAQGVAATPMTGWGPQNGTPFVRFVFSKESCARLQGIGAKVRRALGA